MSIMLQELLSIVSSAAGFGGRRRQFRTWRPRRGDVVSFDARRGTPEIRVVRGRVWATLEGADRDVVLAEGDEFTPRCAGRLVLEALGASTVLIRESVPAPRRAANGLRSACSAC